MQKLTKQQLWLLILLTLVWGVNWPVMKMGVTNMPPLLFRAMSIWLGLPVLEAMCCGGLVVTSRVSAMAGVLGDAGIYCDPYDTGDMTRAMREALTMPLEDVGRLREAARRRALELLSRWAAEPPLPGLEHWRQSAS